MGQKISILPTLEKHRLSRAGEAQVVLIVYVNNKHAARCTEINIKILPAHWDEDKRRVRRTHQNESLLNNKIDSRILELNTIFLQKEIQGLKLTALRVKQIVKGIDPGKSFIAFCKKQIKDKYGNKETVRTYMGDTTKLEEYAPDLTFTEIDFLFLQEYAAWMRDEKKNSPNTIWKAFKFMNTMMNDAMKVGGIIKENPFDNFDRGKYVQTQRTYLTKSERHLLQNTLKEDIPVELERVINYMLFMCYAGLRFEDAMTFEYDKHIIDDERIIIKTEKADEVVNIKIYPKLREVLQLIKHNPLKISNQEFNRAAKVAATLAGINKNITAHVGRHTFGCVLAENGVDKHKAQRLLGHRDIRSTNVYYHMNDTVIDKEVDDKLGGV